MKNEALFTVRINDEIIKQREQLQREREQARTQIFARNATIRALETRAAGYQPLQRKGEL
mgnify:FL=1